MGIEVNINYNLIQSLRLVHVLAESDFSLTVPKRDEGMFALLRETFNNDFTYAGDAAFDLLNYITTSLAEPLTSVGEI